MDLNSENKIDLHDLSFNGKLEQITKLPCLEKYINEPDIDGRTPLHLSCFQNHFNVAKYLINSNANVNCQDTNLTTPLHWAVYNNNIDLVQILIDKKSTIQAKDINGIQPLHLASLKGNVQIIRLIMSKGEIQEKVVDNQGISPVHLAAYCGHIEAIEVLLEYFDVNDTDNRSINALNLAASCGQTKSVQLLIKKGASTYYGDNLHRCPLHWAAVSGDLEMIKPLVPPDYYDNLDKFKCTPLFLSTSYGHDDAVCYFLKKNLQLYLESGQSDKYLILTNLEGPDSVVNKNFSQISVLPTTIHWAAAFCSPNIIGKLLDAGANIEELGIRHNTPLHTAAAFGNQPVLKFLLDLGADINAKDEDDSTALHWAIVHRHIECVTLLIESDADTTDALCWAAAGGDLNIFKLLHETTDCDINENEANDSDEYSRNPLMWAATCGHANIINYLLDNGADTSCYDVIHWCAVNGLIDSIKKLLELGVDINESDLGFNRTALHWAAICGNVDVVKFLLSIDGIEVNAVEDQGDLPIHYAVAHKHLEIIKLLIDHGAHLNKRGDLGRSLCMAARDGDFDIVKMLINGGADVNRSEFDDETSSPLYFAIESGNMDIVTYLIEKGAKKNYLIHHLAEYGSVKDIEKFIKSNDINSVDDCLRTPLFFAVKNVDNLKYFISLGSNINHHDYLNKTPVYHAIESKCLETVEILIKESCDLNYNTRREGYTPLIRAIETENFELFKLLVDNNASLIMRDDDQRTPLHHAAKKIGSIGLKMLQYLLSKGVEINVYDLYGITPLYLAVKSVHYSAYYDTNVKYLLDNGAELNTLAKNDEYTLTPLSYAVMNKNFNMVKLLILNGADLCLDPNIINYCSDVSYLKLLCFAGLRFKNLQITRDDSNIQNFIKHVESNPFNLKALCRITLRYTFGKNYLRFVNNANNVPTLVKEYLLFNSHN